MKKGRPAAGEFKDEVLDIYLREIESYPLINHKEEKKLARKIKKKDQPSFEKLIRSNLRFVITVAKRYQNRGLSLTDLIAEGNVGLIKAALRYDERKGIRFISYAVWWIRQSILQALAEQSRIFRVPINRADALHRIKRTSSTMTQALGREPSLQEISSEMEINQEEIGKLLSILRTPLSLDSPLFMGDDDRKFIECLPDDEDHRPDEVAFEKIRIEVIRDILQTLKDRETKILNLYYGLGGRDPMTLEEIGAILGITRERVRQIKERALERLRHASRRRKLEAYIH
jgi:RNA polymerase primary sigma factor